MLRSALIHTETYLLTHPKMGHYLSLHKLKKPYLIGFCTKDLCMKAKMYSKDAKQYDLRQHCTQNMLANLPPHQLKQWVDVGITKMDVNFDGRIYLQKQIIEPEKQCLIQEIPTDQFVMYPFEKKLGVIICKDIMDESHEQVVFSGIIIEPNLMTH
jgi:hypothetical protein